MNRRDFLASSAVFGLAGCSRRTTGLEGSWVGASHERGHRLREQAPLAGAVALHRRASAVVVGTGVAGLAAARALSRAGIDDVALLELEDAAGGNSRGHTIGSLRCPLGAHYLPLPGPQAHEVSEWLEEIGLSRVEHGRVVFDDRHLCHSPQERLFIDGHWREGLLPPAEPGSATLAQYQRFARFVAQAQRNAGFAIPSVRAPWTATHAALDAQTFNTWLNDNGLDDARLRWYLDYCCRDDYGAGSAQVSAWAGLHYFASRHGFHAPGDGDGEREAVLTWPEGNAWLLERLAAPWHGERLHTGRMALRVVEERQKVTIDVWDQAARRLERWHAEQVILAVPLFITARLLGTPRPALSDALSRQRHAPWLVANLLIDEPLTERPGAPLSWDNVVYGSQGLGYVNARHQSLDPTPGPTVLTMYWALGGNDAGTLRARRAQLLQESWGAWSRRVIDDLSAAHPDLPYKARRADLMRFGHAMSIPVPGLRGSDSLLALRQPSPGRVHLAHADLAGYSIFEEAFTIGMLTGERVAQRLAAPRLADYEERRRRTATPSIASPAAKSA